MCCRYFLEDDPELMPIMEAVNRSPLAEKLFPRQSVHTAGDVRPADVVPVVAPDRKGARAVFPMQWGFHTDQGLVFNARSETAHSKPLFQDSFQHRRCLIPMMAYFEWDHRQRPMLKYRFEPQETSYACFAGLYRFEGQNPVFTILTRNAAPSIAQFHDRMPVILPRNIQDEFLLGSVSDADHALTLGIEQLSFGAVW